MRVPQGKNVIGGCVTDKGLFTKIREEFNPTHVIHCAGVCDLDVCEERPLWAHAMNTTGAQVIGEVFGKSCHITYLSSDLVFSGEGAPLNGYDESSIPDPLSVAGKTIRKAEIAIAKCERYCILRLGLPIGESVTGDKGAVGFIRSRFRRNLPVTLFFDEWRSCILCEDIVSAVMGVLEIEPVGVFHCGGPVKRSLHEVGRYVLESGDYDSSLLKGIYRREEKNGPPRMGDVSLDSSKLSSLLGLQFSVAF